MKVLVTGSRSWTNRAAIERELRELPPGSVIVHGACKTGADAMADEIARELGFTVRRYPADWDKHGKSAGPVRNMEMVNKEHVPEEPIDLTLAFMLENSYSPGTLNCSMRAMRAGIKVKEVNS